MKAYYNEIEPFAVEWLENLIYLGVIPPGDVDARSIADVSANDIAGYDQCHFFAGIGGWAYALRLAGWPESEPVWTGSCPCQPFSVAGQGKGEADKRHLWPHLFRLIIQSEAMRCFGEQVSGKGGLGWLSGVQADLDFFGYRIGASALPAGGFSAPHRRERLWWVADQRLEYTVDKQSLPGAEERRQAEYRAEQSSGTGRVAHARGGQREQCRGAVADAGGGPSGSERDGQAGGMEYADGEGLRRDSHQQLGQGFAGPWSDFDIIPFLDGKARRVESGSFPLAHGVSGRVGRLRGYGNAIVPQVAAEFIRAYMDEVGL